MKKLFGMLLGALLLVSISSAANAETYDEEVYAVQLLNELRAEHGLEPLEWDPESDLQQLANIRAQELEHIFAHTRPDGSDCFSILAEYGIRYRSCGENIAMGTGVDAEQVMEMWINSPGHFANMISADFEEVGFAYWLGEDKQTVYWVQLFLTR